MHYNGHYLHDYHYKSYNKLCPQSTKQGSQPFQQLNCPYSNDRFNNKVISIQQQHNQKQFKDVLMVSISCQKQLNINLSIVNQCVNHINHLTNQFIKAKQYSNQQQIRSKRLQREVLRLKSLSHRNKSNRKRKSILSQTSKTSKKNTKDKLSIYYHKRVSPLCNCQLKHKIKNPQCKIISTDKKKIFYSPLHVQKKKGKIRFNKISGALNNIQKIYKF